MWAQARDSHHFWRSFSKGRDTYDVLVDEDGHRVTRVVLCGSCCTSSAVDPSFCSRTCGEPLHIPQSQRDESSVRADPECSIFCYRQISEDLSLFLIRWNAELAHTTPLDSIRKKLFRIQEGTNAKLFVKSHHIHFIESEFNK
jgi:hypothetical protein